MRGESEVRTICKFPPVRPAPTDRLHSEVWPTEARVSPPTERPPAFFTRTARPTVFRNLQIVCNEALYSHRTHLLILASCASSPQKSKWPKKSGNDLPLKLCTSKA